MENKKISHYKNKF